MILQPRFYDNATGRESSYQHGQSYRSTADSCSDKSTFSDTLTEYKITDKSSFSDASTENSFPSNKNPLSTQFPTTSGPTDSPFLRALRGERPEHTPVWFMRQAGRSLPEYRELRARSGKPMLQACLDPELVVEATLQPVRRLGVDAAVLYSDIMVPLLLSGVDVVIEPGVGPVMSEPVRSEDDVDRLITMGTQLTQKPGLEAIREAVARTVSALATTPLIAFGGAPFTLACYLTDGRPTRDRLWARRLMRSHPKAWAKLLNWCAEVTGTFIAEQVKAGASAAQLFDSWVGVLSEEDYRQNIAPHSAHTLDLVRAATSPTSGVSAPIIHFGTGTPHLLTALHEAGADAIGVDERIGLDAASALLGDTVPLQGNLDPAYLHAPRDILFDAVDEVIRRAERAPSHIFNLAHGVPQDADPDALRAIVERVHTR